MERLSGLAFPARARARAILTAALAALLLLLAPATARANAATEKAAKALQKKAMEEDYLNVDLDKATEHLNDAIAKCGASNCNANLRALLRRDLATVFTAANKKDEALATMIDALKIDGSIQLDPNYKTKELEGIYAQAKKGGGGSAAPSSGGGGTPSGDFSHTPAAQQAARTPLPIYVEYTGSEAVTKVIVKYKSFGMTDWKPLEMKKMGDKGWGATIPCADIQQGDVHYYLQGFNANNDPVATGGDRNNSYKTTITKDFAGEPLHLPGEKPPQQCADTGDCPPDFPGCNKKVTGEADNLKGEGEDCEEDNQCKSGSCVSDKCTKPKEEETPTASGGGKLRRFWVGAGLSLDLQFVPGANDVCVLNNSAQPGNPGYYCVDPSGKGYPGTGTPLQNADILIGKNDQVNGGILPSNFRIFASFDYAFNYNIMVGVRFGYTLMTYPGSAYSAFPPLLIEGRGTYVFGKEALATKGFAPLVFLGGGAANFTSKVGVSVSECDGMGEAPAGSFLATAPKNTFNHSTAVTNQGKPGSGNQGKGEGCVVSAGATSVNGTGHNVDAWHVGGPAFIGPGGGIRYAFSDRAAVTVDVKLAMAFGTGFLFDPTPEAQFQFGF